jgi:hypothetical protein
MRVNGAILAPAHRGVTHVRGTDCVHLDIGRVIVRMIRHRGTVVVSCYAATV